MMHDGYRFGPGSLSITIFFVLMVVCLIFYHLRTKNSGAGAISKIKRILVSIILVAFFIVQMIFFLDYYSMYFFHGYAMGFKERLTIVIIGAVVSISVLFLGDRVKDI
jgi:hypothetical protein